MSIFKQLFPTAAFWIFAFFESWRLGGSSAALVVASCLAGMLGLVVFAMNYTHALVQVLEANGTLQRPAGDS